MSVNNPDLFLLTAPIGNPDDITLKALNCLRQTNVLLCEEPRLVRTWLKYWGIDFYQGQFDKDSDRLYILTFDENTDSREMAYLKQDVLPHVNSVAFMSGAGCPMFHDPGNRILKTFRSSKLHYISGVSSLGALLMHLPQSRSDSGFEVFGFLPREKTARRECWRSFSITNKPIFLMETAYRLQTLCNELAEYAKNMQILFGYALTKPNEIILKGSVTKMLPRIRSLEKDDFVFFLIPSAPQKPNHTQQNQMIGRAR